MKKERKVIDAHLHIFGHCEFGDRLAQGIGDEPTQEYLTEKYYGRLGIEKGIVMGNGPLEEQGKNLGSTFTIVPDWMRRIPAQAWRRSSHIFRENAV